jgi:hypothetical protein
MSDRLTLAADALVFTLALGSVFMFAKNLANIPVSWIDSLDGFHLTMILASIAGATLAWLVHRGPTGLRGWGMLAAGIAASLALVLSIDAAITWLGSASAQTATLLLIGVQAAGLIALLGLIAFSSVNVVRPRRRRFDPMAVARLAALAMVAANVAFRFLPESRIDFAAASLYAIIGLGTIEGAMGAALGDQFLLAANRRAARVTAPAEGPTANA